MSFLDKFSRAVDARVFSPGGLSDEWLVDGVRVPAILDEQIIEDENVATQGLILEVQKRHRHYFKPGALITCLANGESYRVGHIGKSVNGAFSVILRDKNAT